MQAKYSNKPFPKAATPRRKSFTGVLKPKKVKVKKPEPLEELQAKLKSLPADEQAAIAAVLEPRPTKVRYWQEIYLREALELLSRALVCECKDCVWMTRDERLEAMTL